MEGYCDYFFYFKVRYIDYYLFNLGVVFICDVMRVFFSRFEKFYFYFFYVSLVCEDFSGDRFI